MEVETALDKLGSFRRWQMVHFTVLGLAVMLPSAFHMVAIVYIGYIPPHRCKIPEGYAVNDSIPMEGNKLSSCKIYLNYTPGNKTTDCINGWDYLGNDGPTIVTKWDLVCDRDVLTQLSQTFLVLGVMFGAVLFSFLSDHQGRKPIFMISQVAMVIIGIATALNNNLYVFFVLRFLAGAIQQGIIIPGFILTCELFSSKNRTFVGTMIEQFWCLATCLFPWFAYLFSNWVYLQLFISSIGLLTIPLFKWLPESVVWLNANDRTDEAENIIKSALKFNKIILEEEIILARSGTSCLCDREHEKDTPSGVLKKNEEHTKVPNDSHYSVLDLFRKKRLAVHLVIMSILWMVVTLVYYGLTLSTALLAGNRYWNAFFNSLVEFPANFLAYLFLNRLGRKWPLLGFWLLTGISLLIEPFLPDETANGSSLVTLHVCLSMLGKLGITSVFSIIVLYGSEIFPTNLRGQALGIMSFFGRMGNFIASFASYIMQKNPSFLALLFGILSIFSALLVIFLPETSGRPLPETAEEIELWFDKSKQKKKNVDS